jgi:hypothetical protein
MMEEIDWNKVRALLEFRAKNRRGYASDFEWHVQDEEERFVMLDFLKALKTKGELDFSDVKPFEPDPPDFVAKATDGTTIAFELREFVSEEAIRRTAKGERVMAWWTDEQFFGAIDKIIRAKDGKTFNGGPYSRIVLIMPTGEPTVTAEMVTKVFAGSEFDKPLNITDAYLMMDAPVKLPRPGEATERVCQIFKTRFRKD